MKKSKSSNRLIIFSLILTLASSFSLTEAFGSNYSPFWEQLFNPYSNNRQNDLYSSTYIKKDNRLIRELLKNRRFFLRRNSSKNKQQIQINQNNSYNKNQYILATISSPTNSSTNRELTTKPINVFQIGLRNAEKSSYLRAPEAVMIDKMTFQLFSKNGIFDEANKFSLVIDNEESFPFSNDGKVTIQFKNSRLAAGESLALNIAVKVDDPNNIRHSYGSAKLQLLGISAYKEISRKNLAVMINGSRLSRQIVYDPVPTTTVNPDSTIISTAGSSIYGDILVAGQNKYVLATELRASYDDLAISKITVHNNLTGNLIDSQINEIQLVNLKTGELLSSTRFVNGEARFLLSPELEIARNSSAKIGFLVKAKNNPRNNGDRRFKLDLFPRDMVVKSLSNGRELPNSNKNFNTDSEIFLVLESRLDISNTEEDTTHFSINTGQPESVYDFQIKPSGNSASISRLSLEVYPNGLGFNGGSASADDFELVENTGNRERSLDTSVSVSGNKVIFDFNSPYTFYENSAKKFRLKVALTEFGAASSSDGVSIRMNGDSFYSQGNLSAVKDTGSNFIWSDRSSNDFFNGYKLYIPSNSVYIKR